MPELNTIKVKQIDSSVWSHVSGILTGSFGSAITNYIANGGSLGNNILYTSNVDQTISGKKDFLLSIGIPYTGGSGDAVSKQYVDDKLGLINDALSPLSNAHFLYANGNRVISGETYIAGSIYSNSIQNTGNPNAVNIFTATLIGSDGAGTVNWNNKQLFGDWTVDGHSFVYADTNQSILGVKTFLTEVVVPTAVNAQNPVTFTQFKKALGDSGQYFNDLYNTISKVTSSGFGGILSLNGQSGNIFTQGRGTVTVYQRGNILNISGAQIERQAGDSIFATQVRDIDYGVSVQRVNFDNTYDNQPIIISQITNSAGDSPIYSLLSGIDTSGFSVVLSEETSSADYKVSYIVFDATGLISMLKGEQGLMGPYLKGRGIWDTGRTYGYLDFVRTENGVSWYSKTGHLSTSLTSPLLPGGANYWELLASGSGPKGDNAVPFMFKGTWSATTAYTSGQAVIYQGASYATLSSVATGIAPTGSPWFVVAAKGESGAGFTFKGDWSNTPVYNLGDVVRFNNASYIVSTSGASGSNAGPASLNTKFTLFAAKGITFRSTYSATEVYYPYDVATVFNASGAPVQWINNGTLPLYSFHPYGNLNDFIDCDGFTGHNLIQLTTGVKSQFHPYFGKGDASAFKINDLSINESGSGWGTLTLVRGKRYFFDTELSGFPVILTTNPTGGNYVGQIINGVLTGNRLSANTGNYIQAGLNQHVASGSFVFSPTSGTPDDIYFQSPNRSFAGWKIKIVDASPWQVFASGIKGDSIVGPTGDQGLPGLAFQWMGDWNGSVGYQSGQAVYWSGSSYGTNSSVIGTQPSQSPWFLVAQRGEKGADARGLAFVWQGNWSATTQYNPYDSVYYNGTSYATSGSVSGNYPPDVYSNYWFPVARRGGTGIQGEPGVPGISFGWRGEYQNFQNYYSGDAVFFEGSSYGTRFDLYNVSPTGTGLANTWELLAQRGGSIFSWRGAYNSGSSYNSGDAIFYKGSSYATLNYTLANTSPESEFSQWFLVAQKGDSGNQGDIGPQGPRGTGGLAFEWRGAWSAVETYSSKDAVFYDGSAWGTLYNISGTPTPAVAPNLSSKWFLISQKGDPGLAFGWKGNWSATTIYRPNEAVYYQGRSYGTTGYLPTGLAPSPTTGPWFVIADKGGQSVAHTVYLDGAATGYLNKETRKVFTPYSFSFTGFSIGLDTYSSSGTSMGGSIFYMNQSNAKTTIASFTVSTGQGFVSSGNFAVTIPSNCRLGVSLTSGSLTDASGMTFGIFGYTASL
jgi:hypothetical protein